MGIFAELQPIYAEHNIPTFPVVFEPDGRDGGGRLSLKEARGRVLIAARSPGECSLHPGAARMPRGSGHCALTS